MSEQASWNELHWNEQGLIPAVVQDVDYGRRADDGVDERDVAAQDARDGQTHFWSRSRKELWHKGDTSGNVQRVLSICVDCDGDTLLVQVEPAGPACHTGRQTCFYREFDPDGRRGLSDVTTTSSSWCGRT